MVSGVPGVGNSVSPNSLIDFGKMLQSINEQITKLKRQLSNASDPAEATQINKQLDILEQQRNNLLAIMNPSGPQPQPQGDSNIFDFNDAAIKRSFPISID